MLLLDDDDELPSVPTKGEASLATVLGAARLGRIDEALTNSAGANWHKVARIVYDAVKSGGFDHWDDSCLHLHVRRVIRLVDIGVFEAQGNLHRPRWSEVRLRKLRLV